MCCDAPEAAMLPPPVAAMLEGYRARQAERPNDWGDELPGLARGQAYARWLGARLVEVVLTGQDWPAAVRGCLTDPLPAGLIVASLDGGGIGLRAGPRPYAVPGGTVEVAVLLDSHLERPTRVEVDGIPRPVEAGGVELVALTAPDARTISVGTATAPAGERAAPARLRLRAPAPSRWSVVDGHGGAWFPRERPRKWDANGRPMFHGNDLLVDVPAVPLTVTCARARSSASPRPRSRPSPEARPTSSWSRRGCTTPPPAAGTAATSTST